MGTVDRLSGPQRSRCDRYECGYKQFSAAAQLKHCSPEYRFEQDCPLSQWLTAGLRAANAYPLLVDFHRNYSMHSLNGEVSEWTTNGNSNYFSKFLLVSQNEIYGPVHTLGDGQREDCSKVSNPRPQILN